MTEQEYQEWLQEDPLNYMPEFIPEDKDLLDYESIEVI